MYNQEKQGELFEDFVSQKYRIQKLAGIIQNNWNEFKPTNEEMEEWFNEAVNFSRELEKKISKIRKFWRTKE